jgi:hypothetical protein
MRKKSGFTIVERATALVPEFEKVVARLQQQVTLRGQSKRPPCSPGRNQGCGPEEVPQAVHPARSTPPV